MQLSTFEQVTELFLYNDGISDERPQSTRTFCITQGVLINDFLQSGEPMASRQVQQWVR